MPTDLFASDSELRPLAERMRPRSLDEFVGQQRLLGPGAALRRALEAGQPHSMILWGPPGCGKTSLALLLAKLADAEFQALSAVMSGIADVRRALADADSHFHRGRRSVLFIDEVHRFNKAQQDAFLPHTERGVILFVGATTENPSFELNSALLSRCRVYVMEAVSAEDIRPALDRALADGERGLGGRALGERGLGGRALHADAGVLDLIAQAADGDVRRGLTLLEIAADISTEGRIDMDAAIAVTRDRSRRFDKGGEQFYDQISALHKSVRNSHPDAALYWFARMLDGGCDPHYLARRLVRMAVEDIGNADPRALPLTISAWEAWDRLGSPEGDLALAQAVVHLACTAKSNAVYTAYGAARRDVIEFGTAEVPLHLRNAPTKLMKEIGYGKGYQYDPDVEGGVALDQTCFPDSMGERVYYQPTGQGAETRLAEHLRAIREARRKAQHSKS
ncbi:MAG TPA: replication-associated recombination protein A [Xanthomonadaceae bacterium]|nr:replication-associated recombination protein A [Xanthomonadaceae bacterium]